MTGEVNTAPGQASYRCEAVAEGFVGGTDETARYVLGTFWTISPVLALRWLGGQALWIVGRLDLVDHLAELRAWYEDRETQRTARAHIKGGAPLLVVVPDEDCTYTVSVRSAEQAHGTTLCCRPGEGSPSEIARRTPYDPPTAAAPCATCGG
ncbi:hypothetical protein OOK13_12060 [Streptomyces sp. NBC_00378]|uniref:hypothetical protein n=1 Tax=unclassified Streptomyces TaxID=2593676 RepID=UPI002259FBFB|nr:MULTISPECIES: hypothetical protein [unclassified Streptomyces]MCX5109252.1 hypothetical protein [Streptomyces sp. NBC_00378]